MSILSLNTRRLAKRFVKQMLAPVCLLALCLFVGSPAVATEVADWQAAYADTIVSVATEFATKEDMFDPQAGVLVTLVDLDFDGVPEMYLGMLAQGQYDYLVDDQLHTFREGRVVLCTIAGSAPGDPPMGQPLQKGSEGSERNHISLVIEPESGLRRFVSRTTSNEGAYDYAAQLTLLQLQGESMEYAELAAFNLPDELESSMEDDEEATRYFNEQAEAFMQRYEVVSDQGCTTFTLRFPDDWGTNGAPAREDVLRQLQEYCEPVVGC